MLTRISTVAAAILIVFAVGIAAPASAAQDQQRPPKPPAAKPGKSSPAKPTLHRVKPGARLAAPRVRAKAFCNGGVLLGNLRFCGDATPQDVEVGRSGSWFYSGGSWWFWIKYRSFSPYGCEHYYFDYYLWPDRYFPAWRYIDNTCNGRHAWVRVRGV